MYSELMLPRLASSVEAFWSLEGSGGARRILPDGCMDFIFNLDTGFGVVVGTMNSSQVVTVPAGARRFGVRFAPGAGAAFLDAHASELTDGQASLSEVTKAAAFCLAERVAQAPDDAQRARIVTGFLEDRGSRLRPGDARVHRATDALRRSQGQVPIPELAASVGMSERQLERLFRERVGTRPKLLARVIRMQRALACLESTATYRAARAVEAGFSDESHLVREFRLLTGVTPRQLFHERHVGIVQSSE
jgi:AraC-like DNA-binding protein